MLLKRHPKKKTYIYTPAHTSNTAQIFFHKQSYTRINNFKTLLYIGFLVLSTKQRLTNNNNNNPYILYI